MALKVDEGTEPGVDLGPVISKQVRRWMYIFFFNVQITLETVLDIVSHFHLYGESLTLFLYYYCCQ